jgi:rhomboid protease GluP
MNIRYNAPVTLTFSILCVAVLYLGGILGSGVYSHLFTVPGSAEGVVWSDPWLYFRFFSYSVGHASSAHLFGNISLLLLIGPLIEEKYGSKPLLVILLITVLITGLLNALLFQENLLGASGVVFMMILLSSFANIKRGEIPLTLIAVLIVFVSKEVVASFQSNQVSEFAHLIGACCGAFFGFKRS